MQRQSIGEQRKITAQVVERNGFRLSSKFADSSADSLADAFKTGRCHTKIVLRRTPNRLGRIGKQWIFCDHRHSLRCSRPSYSCHPEHQTRDLVFGLNMREYHFYVYILQSASRRALYIGMTNNLRHRVF